jgi:hypothetical protein
MKKLLKQTFELWVKMRWLKTIDKEIKKRQKYKLKYLAKVYVIDHLVTEYNKKYADSVIKREDTE